jgi:hypothetical protein
MHMLTYLRHVCWRYSAYFRGSPTLSNQAQRRNLRLPSIPSAYLAYSCDVNRAARLIYNK